MYSKTTEIISINLANWLQNGLESKATTRQFWERLEVESPTAVIFTVDVNLLIFECLLKKIAEPDWWIKKINFLVIGKGTDTWHAKQYG